MGMIQNKVKVSQPVSHIIIENAGGLQGPAGAPGQPGPQGETGPAGQDGKDGTSATVAVGTTTTLPAGSSATVTNTGTSSDAVFNFGIPKGDKGDKGDAGAGLVITGSVDTYADLPNDLGPEDAGKAYFVEADGKLYVWSGTQFPAEGEGSQFEGPQGPAGQDGADGQAATITVGSTTTLSPGASATVTNSGTSSAAVFDFGIPQGATGATGPAGPANTLSIGTVEGGDTAAATITGTAPNQTLNLTLPKGDQGDPGPEPEMVRNAKGTTIELTDAGSNIISLNDMYGDTEQTTYTGRNLLNAFANYKPGQSYTHRSVTFTFNADGSIKVKGTATGGIAYVNLWGAIENDYTTTKLTIPTPYQVGSWTNQNIILSCRTTSGAYFDIYKGSGATTGNYGGTAVGAFYLQVPNGSSVDETIYPQIVSGSTLPEFEPYVGGVASPNPDYPQVVQTVTGEQIITISDGENQTSSYTIDLGQNFWSDLSGSYSRTLGSCVCVTKSNGHITMNGTSGGSNNWTLDSASAASNGMLVSLEAGTYTMFTDNTTIQKQVIWTNSDGSSEGLLVDSTSSGVSFTLTETKLVYVRARVLANTAYSEDISVEIQKGTTQRTPIELCKIGDYQDYIYKNNGNWYVHKETWKITFDGSESWYYNSNNKNLLFTNDGTSYFPAGTTYVGYSDGGVVVCPYFVERQAGQGTSKGDIWASSPNLCVVNWDGLTNFDSSTNFKSWLSTHNMDVYYQLSTPTDTQITDATLISQLNAVSSAALYEGNTDITVTSSNLAGEIDIDYWTYFHRTVQTNDIADGAITVPKINSLQDLADALRPYLS